MTGSTLRPASLIESLPFNAVLAALYAAFLAVYFASATPPLDVTHHAIGRDFINLWTAGGLLAQGHVRNIFDPSIYHVLQDALFDLELPYHNWSYPPHMLLIAAPLAVFPYLASLALWSSVTLAAYLLIARGRSMIVLLLAPATFANLFFGQTGCLVAALLIGGLRWLDRRPVLAGVLFGLASIKPHLGLLIPLALVAVGAWRTIASAAITVVALVALSALAFGWEAWEAWFAKTAPYQTWILEHGTGLFTWMMPSVFMGARILGLEPSVAYLAQAPFALFAIGATLWAFRTHGSTETTHAALLLATVIATPYIHIYDLTLIGPAVLVLLTRARGDGFLFGERLVWPLVWTLPFVAVAINLVRWPVGGLILAVALGLVVARLKKQAGARGGPSPPEA